MFYSRYTAFVFLFAKRKKDLSNAIAHINLKVVGSQRHVVQFLSPLSLANEMNISQENRWTPYSNPGLTSWSQITCLFLFLSFLILKKCFVGFSKHIHIYLIWPLHLSDAKILFPFLDKRSLLSFLDLFLEELSGKEPSASVH